MEHVTENCNCTGKFCNDCKLILCILKFSTDSYNNNGFRPYCKNCNKIRCYNYRHNIITIKNVKTYQVEHISDNCKCNGKICSDCKKELCIGKFYISPDYFIQSYCKLCMNKYKKQYYSEHKKDAILLASIYRDNNPDLCSSMRQNRRALKKNANGSFTKEQWQELKQYYDYTCLACGKVEPEISLTIDHIIPLSKGGSNDISNIQPLCDSCNKSKKDKIIDFRKTIDTVTNLC